MSHTITATPDDTMVEPEAESQPESPTESLYDQVAELLHQSRSGAPTRPMSVTVPAPLADAFRLLADHDRVTNVSAAVVEAMTGRLQSIVIGLHLEETYAEFPDSRPTEDEVQAMAVRMGVTLP